MNPHPDESVSPSEENAPSTAFHPTAMPDWDENLYQQTCATLYAEESNTSNKYLPIFIASVVLFAISFADGFNLQDLLILLGVIFIHELGHFLGMIGFGYKNVRMFFIPFFGAAVSGKSHAVAIWKTVVVLLLGPIPGILIGVAILLYLEPNPDDLLSKIAFYFLLINTFNLLPFVPLDGGRVFERLFFVRQPWLTVLFRLFAVICLGWFAWWASSWVMGIISIFLFFGLPVAYNYAKIARGVRENPLQFPERIEDLTEEERIRLFTMARMLNMQMKEPWILANEMRNLHESMVAKHPNFWTRMLLVFVYCFGITFAGTGSIIYFENVQKQIEVELVDGFFSTVGEVQDLLKKAELQEKLEAKNPKPEDEKRLPSALLKREADLKWQMLVIRWKMYSFKRQVEAIQKVQQRIQEPNRMHVKGLFRLMTDLEILKPEELKVQ